MDDFTITSPYHHALLTVIMSVAYAALAYKRGVSRRKCIAWGAVGVGIATAVLLTCPSHEERKQTYEHAFHFAPEDVSELILEPIYQEDNSLYWTNLVKKPVLIADQKQIARVRKALNSIRPFAPNHPGPRWNCRVRILTEDWESEWEVYWNPNDEKNGVMIHLTYGFWLKEYRCDAIRPVLEEIAIDAQARNADRALR